MESASTGEGLLEPVQRTGFQLLDSLPVGLRRALPLDGTTVSFHEMGLTR